VPTDHLGNPQGKLDRLSTKRRGQAGRSFSSETLLVEEKTSAEKLKSKSLAEGGSARFGRDGRAKKPLQGLSLQGEALQK